MKDMEIQEMREKLKNVQESSIRFNNEAMGLF
jgi:hypothetical protein